jgi:hypothetical protein
MRKYKKTMSICSLFFKKKMNDGLKSIIVVVSEAGKRVKIPLI